MGMRAEPAESLRRRVAGLLIVRASGHLADGQRRYPRWEHDNASLRRLLGQGLGGVILLGGSAAELRLRTRQLQALSREPLLLCADVEEGVVILVGATTENPFFTINSALVSRSRVFQFQSLSNDEILALVRLAEDLLRQIFCLPFC